MPFIAQEPFTFFNIKLTDYGRNRASLGKINFDKVIISDREIDYSIDREKNYNILNNRILDISHFYPDTEFFNFNGAPYYDKNQFTVSTELIQVTGTTSSTTISNVVKGTKTLNYSPNSANWGTNKIAFNAGGYLPVVNDIVFIPWVSPKFAGNYNLNSIQQNVPSTVLTYKIISADSATVFYLDRPIPNFFTPLTNPTLTCHFFEDNLIDGHIGTSTSSDPLVWNLSIVRTSTVPGSEVGLNGVSGYTTYGSIEYNGAKHFFGFGNDLVDAFGNDRGTSKPNVPIFGLIHYTNKYSGNTYAEQFVEKTFELNFPTIMWYHNNNAYYNNDLNNKFTSVNSSGTTWGLYLSDFYGPTNYDSVAKSTYRELRDGRDKNSISVGRVYHKLRMVVILDQELLSVLTYKSNRNYALPDFSVDVKDTPQIGLYPANSFSGTSISGFTASGLVEDDKDYFITYIAESNNYSSLSSLGNPPNLPCGYIKKITGSLDENGNSQFLTVRFPYSNSFPYMRNDVALTNSTYFNGWNANTIQLLINVQPSVNNYDSTNVPYTGWIRVSDKNLGGNGVYRASDFGDNTIDGQKLNGYEFVISMEDYVSGSTYYINSALTANQSYLTFGDECFLYGTVKTGILSTVFKTKIQVYIDDSELNGSLNTTFDPEIDTATYITEIAILDTEGLVVAAGKPTYPILKNNIRWLTLQLDIDF